MKKLNEVYIWDIIMIIPTLILPLATDVSVFPFGQMAY
ncbi:hypothetical protein HALO59_150632 [Halomonas sp. 59]|nr:hypothetical protein HALO59_150632 [Halomonas sp. 59]CAD5262110.1 hypothetical protein HALO113_160634 [Halomonas sp. 113]VXC47243.1 hypothetical protein HALO153_330254 [Halomonas titanicae]